MVYELKKGLFKRSLATISVDYDLKELLSVVNDEYKYNIKLRDIQGIDTLVNSCGVLLTANEVPNNLYTTANFGSSYNIAIKCVKAVVEDDKLCLDFDVTNTPQGEVVVSFLTKSMYRFKFIPNCVLNRDKCKILNFDLLVTEF